MSLNLFGGVTSHVQVRPPLPVARPELFTAPDARPEIVDWRVDEDAEAFPLAVALVLEHAATADARCVRDAALVVARQLGIEPADRGAR